MDHYMPEIFYHDRKALLSVDIHPTIVKGKCKFVTSSVQNEVRIWSYEFENVNLPVAPLAVHFIASLSGHNAAVNQVKFCQNPDYNLLASGDCHGRIAIWQVSDQPPPPPCDDFPPNKENWVRFKVLNHESDVTAIAWSPCGKYLASVSNDDSCLVHEALTGKRTMSVSHLRHFPNGISWDPDGKYLVTMSTDRKMDLLDATKGTKLRTFGIADLPAMEIGNIFLEEKNYKLFHDDQLMFFQRGVSFSPCGQLIVAPCAHLEVEATDIYGTLVFKRWELEKDRPAVILPSAKPTFLVRFCPQIFDLVIDSPTNYSGLPYRLIWLALTKDSIMFYDSQHSHPIGVIENIHYNNLSEAVWSPDGRSLLVSSLEGYCSFFKLKFDLWGTLSVKKSKEFECPPSPQLIQTRKRPKKEKKATVNEKEKKAIVVEKEKEEERVATPTLTPLRPASAAATTVTPKSAPSTPKLGGMLKYLRKQEGSTDSPSTINSPRCKTPVTTDEKKDGKSVKKRVTLITLQ
ncbi:unnamed protein product [Auanema sp. JU1783]|nr:unnamed protein product [Auanema sp. JU1783]